jgi:MFS family permease
VGVLFTAIVAGTAFTSYLVGRYGDRIGRRRTYALLFVALAVTGVAFGLSDNFWVLTIVALAGALSTEVVESGPFTSLEQSILPGVVDASRRTRVFGTYNAVATVAGSVGALAAGGPTLLREVWPRLPPDQRFFLVLVPVGLVGATLAISLSDDAEARRNVLRLSTLFAVDSLAGGFVLQSFISYWLRARFGASAELLGAVFFAVGLLQSASFVVATRLAGRLGLLKTMVFTHLPSNVLLAAIPLAPNLTVAIALLLGRSALSQMDVPTRQAFVVALVDPDERTAAAAYTNTARYAARPLAPALAGASQQVVLGLPFFLGGTIKALYDIALWLWFRRIPVGAEASEADHQ